MNALIEKQQDRIADLEQALNELLSALDAQDERPGPSTAVFADAARMRAFSVLENGHVKRPVLLPLRELIAAGYRPGAPSLECAECDGPIAERSTCEVCGTEGMEYVPFVNGKSYRPFARCPECQHAVEF